MNNAHNFLIILFLSTLLLIGCEKEPILEVSQSSLTFTDQGGTQIISFSTNKDWTASVSGGQGWCTISPSSGNSETRSISVSVVSNTTYDDRTATITINAEELSKVVTITQPKNRAIILAKDSFEVGSAGGNINVELSSNIEYDVTIPTVNQSWITNSTTKGLTTSNLTFAIAPNITYDNRSGKIIIKDKTTALADTVHITQAQKDAIILTNNTFNIADTLIVISVELKSNVTYMVTIPSAAQMWVKQLQTKALKTESLQFEISRNIAFQPRSAEVIIIKSLTTLADTLTINQAKAPNLPSLTTYDASNISGDKAFSGGFVLDDGGGKILTRGICWSKHPNPTTSDFTENITSGIGSFTAEAKGLQPMTKYYMRAFATNRTGTAYGNLITFVTTYGLPIVETSNIISIGESAVSIKGKVVSDGGIAIIDRGMCLSGSQNPTIDNLKVSSGIGIGEFETSISGLRPGEKYYIRAFATNSSGTSYGNEISIITLKGFPIINLLSMNISSNNIVNLTGSIPHDGGSEIRARGICWSTDQVPTIEDNKTNNNIGTGEFKAQISNLQKNTKYYFRGYAINEKGVSYSKVYGRNTHNDPVSDIDGNIYSTILIGSQIWLAENLKVTRYKNGDIISTTTPLFASILNQENPKYQWPAEHQEANVNRYGRHYTWHSVTDNRGICPDGWHLPSLEEWYQLINYLGGEQLSEPLLLDSFNSFWNNKKNYDEQNNSGFTIIPAGGRDPSGIMAENFIGLNASFWTSSSVNLENANFLIMKNSEAGIKTGVRVKNHGMSVRCIKN